MATRKGNTGLWSILRVNVSVEGRDGSLPLTTPKGCLNHTTRPRVRHSAGSPPGHIRHIRNPTICPRSYALPLAILYLIPPHTYYTHLYAVKAGYPPRSLTAVIPELPLSSLGLAPGDQLIVVQKSGSAAPSGVSVAAPTGTSSSPSSPVNPAYPGHTPAAARPTPSSNPAPSKIEDVGPDYVSTDGGYLIHTVRSELLSELRVRSCHSDLRVVTCPPPLSFFFLAWQVVPDDNSCLFASIALVFEQDMRKAPMIRQGTSPYVYWWDC
jgi:hypothetical protein